MPDQDLRMCEHRQSAGVRRPRVAVIRMAAYVVTFAWLAGCATLPDGGRWGEHAGFAAGWERTEHAAMQSASDPWVWAPLVGAAAMQIDNWDHRVSNWAVEHTPVYGSVQNAHDWSNYLEDTAGVLYLGSVLATPGGDYGRDWWDAKLHGALVGFGAMAATGVTAEGLKSLAGRERPDGGHNSFPSGHAAFVSVADTLTAANLVSIPMSDGAHHMAMIGLDTLTFATAWARVEAGAHYPSDVLVGMSIGKFFGQMFTDAFLDDRLSERFALTLEPAKRGGTIAWALRF